MSSTLLQFLWFWVQSPVRHHQEPAQMTCECDELLRIFMDIKYNGDYHSTYKKTRPFKFFILKSFLIQNFAGLPSSATSWENEFFSRPEWSPPPRKSGGIIQHFAVDISRSKPVHTQHQPVTTSININNINITKIKTKNMNIIRKQIQQILALQLLEMPGFK